MFKMCHITANNWQELALRIFLRQQQQSVSAEINKITKSLNEIPVHSESCNWEWEGASNNGCKKNADSRE